MLRLNVQMYKSLNPRCLVMYPVYKVFITHQQVHGSCCRGPVGMECVRQSAPVGGSGAPGLASMVGLLAYAAPCRGGLDEGALGICG